VVEVNNTQPPILDLNKPWVNNTKSILETMSSVVN
jgi:hypothetical protein